MLIHFIIILFIIISCKYNYDMIQFNQITDIKEIHKANKVHIQTELKDKNPIIVHNLLSNYDSLKHISIESLNKSEPGYIIKDNQKLIALDKFITSDQMFIHNNTSMISEFKFESDLNTCSDYFHDKLSCNIKHYLSIYKGNHSISCNKNKHNVTLLHQIYNQSIIYLINPKHTEDIKGKSTEEIKKWSSKLIIDSGQILYIPPEWFYFYETKDTSIIVTTMSDNYFTCIFNTLR